MLSVQVPKLMTMLPQDELMLNRDSVTGGVFDLMSDDLFRQGSSEGKMLWLYTALSQLQQP